MTRRLIELLLALFVLGLATLLIGPVVATMLTPGWLESADGRDWASMTFFLCVAAVFLLVAFRIVFRRAGLRRHVLGAPEWWGIAGLSVIATVSAAIASHWTIALPGLLAIAIAALFARRRAHAERLAIVDAEPDLPPRATFTSVRGSGKS
jgi:hypothetical protein